MRDAGGDLALRKRRTEPVGIIASVAEQGPGPGQGVDHERGTFIVAHLAFAQEHDQRPALAVADRMEL